MLRITAMPGYGEQFVLPALDKLRRKYNDINFDVNFTDEVISLASNDVDIAIRASATPPEQVVARRLDDHDFALVASPEYIIANGAPTVSTDLKGRSVFMYRTPRGVLDWLVQKDGIWKAIELTPKYITNNGQSLLDSVRTGDGIAFLPGWAVAGDIESGRMVKGSRGVRLVL